MHLIANSVASRIYCMYLRLGGRQCTEGNIGQMLRILFLWAPLRWLFSVEDKFEWRIPRGFAIICGVLAATNDLWMIVALQASALLCIFIALYWIVETPRNSL